MTYMPVSEKAMTPHCSTLAWKIPWTEEPRRLQSMGSLRVGQDWAISLSLFTFMHWRRKWQPTPMFLPGDGGAWWAAIYVAAQSRTRLKWLSSSSSLEARSLKSGCQQGTLLGGSKRKIYSLPLLASGGCLDFLAFLVHLCLLRFDVAFSTECVCPIFICLFFK